MDFSDFITLILFLVFVFAPFLKRKKKQTVQKQEKSKQSGFSIFGKLNEVLKEAAREMQAQAEQARKKEAPGKPRHPRKVSESLFDQSEKKSVNKTFWEEIDDRGDVDFYTENVDLEVIEQIKPVNETRLVVAAKKESHLKAGHKPEARGSKSIGHDAARTRCLRSGSRRLPARARGLRKAVIWSEILGKPVALKAPDSFSRY